MSIKKRLSALLIAVVLISSITILPVSAVSDDEIDVSECEIYAQHIINDLMSTGCKRPYAGNYYNKSGDLADELLDVAPGAHEVLGHHLDRVLKEFEHNIVNSNK